MIDESVSGINFQKRKIEEDFRKTLFEQESKDEELSEKHYKLRDLFCIYREISTTSLLSEFKNDFQGTVRLILEIEAPLSEEYFLRRLAWFWGREKASDYVILEFLGEMKNCTQKHGIIRKEGFMYLENMDDFKMRVPGMKREIKYISITELAYGFLALIRKRKVANRKELYQTIGELLGFSRVGELMRVRFSEAIAVLVHKGAIKEEDADLMVSGSFDGRLGIIGEYEAMKIFQGEMKEHPGWPWFGY